MSKKILRNMSTEASKEFWETAQRHASELTAWPDWKRAGINVAQERKTPRPPVAPSPADVEPRDRERSSGD